MARYRKIDTRTWNDKKFNELTDYGKLVFFLLLTHPHLTPIGAMRASLPGLASELNWPLEKLKKALQESFLKDMVRYDETSSFMWLPNFLKYNQPESPNVVKSWEHYLDYLPECELKDLLILQVESYVQGLSHPFQDSLPKAFSKSSLNQEQEQEQEQEKRYVSENADIELKTNDSSTGKPVYRTLQNKFRLQAIEVLNFLNEKTGRAYRPVDTNLKLIIARLKTGASVIDCRQVIAKKTREWKGDKKMAEYLRPATLFNATKFEQYMGELVIPEEEKNAYGQR